MIQKFLTCNEISDNDSHKDISINVGSLTLEDIKQAIERL